MCGHIQPGNLRIRMLEESQTLFFTVKNTDHIACYHINNYLVHHSFDPKSLYNIIRTQAVSYAGRMSPQCWLSCVVPQGSVLGPFLFVLYTADVIGIAMGRGIRIHVYADDTQIYVSCAASDRQPAATRLLACVSEIESWMSSNRWVFRIRKCMQTHLPAVSGPGC